MTAPVVRLCDRLLRRRTTVLPRVTVDPAPQVPGWVLLGLMAVAALSAAALVVSDVVPAVVAVALVVAALVRPSGPGPALVAVGAGLQLLTGGPVGPWIHVLVLLVHLVCQLAAIVGTLPWDARIEARVLARSAGPFLAVQGCAQALVAVGTWASGARVGGGALPLLAGVALAVLAVGVLAAAARDARPS